VNKYHYFKQTILTPMSNKVLVLLFIIIESIRQYIGLCTTGMLLPLLNYSLIILLMIALFQRIAYENLFTKLIILLFILHYGVIFFTYLLSFISITIPFYITLISGILIFECILIIITTQYHITSSAIYSQNQAYIVTQYPRDISALLLSIIVYPFGYYSLVVDGEQYLFKKGILIKRKFINHEKYFLRNIQAPNPNELQKLIGLKWSFTNNCFSVFRRFFRSGIQF